MAKSITVLFLKNYLLLIEKSHLFADPALHYFSEG